MHPDAGASPRVVVTGMGCVTPLGTEIDEFWAKLTSGAVATEEVTRFDTSGYPTRLAAEIKDPRLAGPLDEHGHDVPRCVRYVNHAAEAALRDAKLLDQSDTRRTGVLLGTVMGTRPHVEEVRRRGREFGSGEDWDNPGLLALAPARAFGLRGPREVVAAGCAAGNTALSMAADRIRSGRADVMLAGGADELSEAVFRLFTTLRALAPDQVRPFDRERQGMLPGEGAGILVLESEDHALRRGATILAELSGYAVGADAHHMTAPHPEGRGMLACMRDSLAMAGLTPGDVDYVSAHGTGTPANDALEAAVTQAYFGPSGARPAVSSVKGMLGHAQGGASAVEAIACVRAIRDGRVPGNPTLREPDEKCAELDIVRGTHRDMPVNVALSNAFGFGGNTSTVVFGRYES
ncbi:beta-ketoacyl-[acyl-carrier-protein] synthase family protein [Streptomyces sp. NA04227]|uniref:beta-ketoacyl-[acyl-carrier-protein] synthase family protein n=1 Tax=Streptomyces sp. NA04227 TaxID=2742136 RepID=UPI000A202943|nr:beta-ketoacyl-[acyl-carrier-protein] synthase family protein [Streptomyces sp. NA04227]ARM20262.1 SauC [Streptomyces sp.]QKW07488.1 beta-ketoacyl-[acyl-carrier-protein] synthase family protein [Streptomyces sp. NA04227]